MDRRASSPPHKDCRPLQLAPLAREHFAAISSWFSCAREVAVWAGPSSSFPVGDDQLEEMLAETERVRPRRLARIALIAGEVVAHAQLALDWRIGGATLERVTVASTWRGRGLAGRFLSLFLTEAFSIQSIQRVDLRVFPFNTAAVRTNTRLGFEQEGRLRSSMPFERERWDTLIMGMFRDPGMRRCA